MWPLVVVAVLAAGFVLWWAFIRPGQVQDAAAVTAAQATVAAAAPEIARETLREVERTYEKRVEIERRTATGNAAIAAAPGAAVRVPADVDAAGRAALCLHALYRDDPGCAALPGLRAGRDMGAGAGGAPAVGR
jgi:hypothetical protein